MTSNTQIPQRKSKADDGMRMSQQYDSSNKNIMHMSRDLERAIDAKQRQQQSQVMHSGGI